ncbi:MAG: hypothetical protein ABIT01_11510 [Thermoanaerobaculia bacterium]
MSRKIPFPRLVYDPARRSLYVFLRDRRPEEVARSEHAPLRLGLGADRRLIALTVEQSATTHLGRLETARRLPGSSIGPHGEFLDLAFSAAALDQDRKGWDAILDFDLRDDLIGFQVFFELPLGDPRFLLKSLDVETVRFV